MIPLLVRKRIGSRAQFQDYYSFKRQIIPCIDPIGRYGGITRSLATKKHTKPVSSGQLDNVNEDLADVRSKLKKVQNKIEALTNEWDAAGDKFAKRHLFAKLLKQEADLMSKFLERAKEPPPRAILSSRMDKIKKETEQINKIKKEIEQINRNTEQIRRETEQRNRNTEQLEQQLAAAFVPVRQCIARAPITTQPLYPRWGPPEPDIIKPPTHASTRAMGSWVELHPNHVMEWTDDKFGEFLKRPDQQIVHFNGEDISMIELILRGRCESHFAHILRGETLGSRAGRHGTNKGVTEKPLESTLRATVCLGVEKVCGGYSLIDADLFPAAQFLQTTVLLGNEAAVSKEIGDRGDNTAIGSMPPHLNGIFQTDQSIESIFNPYQDPIADDLRHANICDPENGFTGPRLNDLHQQLLQLASRMARTIIEVKPDYHHPIKYDESKTEEAKEKNAVVGKGLYPYIKSKFYNAVFNPAQQATTYCLTTLTRYFMVATGNRCTYGYVDVLPDGTYRTYLTRTFHWHVPNDIPLDGHVYPHFEIIVRFLLAGRNDWWLGPGYPDSLKLRFKKRQRDNNNNDGDGKGKADGHVLRRVESSISRHSKNSSSGRRGRGNSENVQAPTNGNNYLFSPLCWADLWDEVRFAVPATNPVMEGYMGKLPGDAELLAEGRSGPVYRKTLQGRDAVVKVVVKSRDRRSSMDRTIIKGHVIAEELAFEAAIYKRFRTLQELNVIPQLLWYGEMITDMVDALVTAYAGKSLEDVELTKELVDKARMALTTLHEHGILHGDVARRNFAVSDEDGQVRILDFAFSKLREEMNEETWKREVAEEWEQFCGQLTCYKSD